MNVLFVSSLGSPNRPVYRKRWGSEMNILFVSKLSQFARSIFPITKYVEVGSQLGHRVALYGEQNNGQPQLPYSLDVKAFDFAVFVIYESWDFPDMPYLAQLLDGVPKHRRVIIDCCGRFNDTIRVEHDFNHLEKMDGHQGWEWIEGFQAVSETILQPTYRPLRSDVRPFLWHGFDPASVVQPYRTVEEAVKSWTGANGSGRPYGLTYVGHNWQRWSQLRQVLEGVESLGSRIGPVMFAGSDWEKRPDWAVNLGIQGVDVEPDLLARAQVSVQPPVPFQEMIEFLGKGRFSPVVQRPLFNHLGFVTNRTFATFCADTIPLLMLPEDVVAAVYGPAAEPLRIGHDLTSQIERIVEDPVGSWKAVLETRNYLAEHHSFQRRFQDLLGILGEGHA